MYGSLREIKFYYSYEQYTDYSNWGKETEKKTFVETEHSRNKNLE